ncbi:MAG: response regulator [Chloroflexota bacterium]
MNEHPSVILIVDDTPIGRQSLEALLTGQGYLLLFASNGLDALEVAAASHPDLILLDIMMPVLDGIAVCQRLRADPELYEVPVVMVTALDDSTSRLRSLEAGADDFITKPFDRAELLARVRTITRLNRYRSLMTEREKLRQALDEINQKREDLEHLSHQILEIQERERRSIAIELHDDFGQSLSGLRLILQKERRNSRKAASLAEDPVLSIIDELISRVRNLSLMLRPSMLDDLGLYAALAWLARQFGEQPDLHVTLSFSELDETRYPSTIETSVFRIAQQALTNISRHAQASHVQISLLVDEANCLVLQVEDNGRGFDLSDQVVKGHFSTGLSGMLERARMAGGTLDIDSLVGRGTKITATFPLPKD